MCPTHSLEDQVHVFIFPSDTVAHLYPQAPDNFIVAFYNSQDYGGGILTRLQIGNFKIANTINEKSDDLSRNSRKYQVINNWLQVLLENSELQSCVCQCTNGRWRVCSDS